MSSSVKRLSSSIRSSSSRPSSRLLKSNCFTAGLRLPNLSGTTTSSSSALAKPLPCGTKPARMASLDSPALTLPSWKSSRPPTLREGTRAAKRSRVSSWLDSTSREPSASVSTRIRSYVAPGRLTSPADRRSNICRSVDDRSKVVKTSRSFSSCAATDGGARSRLRLAPAVAKSAVVSMTTGEGAMVAVVDGIERVTVAWMMGERRLCGMQGGDGGSRVFLVPSDVG